jgi:hypothetical protein
MQNRGGLISATLATQAMLDLGRPEYVRIA